MAEVEAGEVTPVVNEAAEAAPSPDPTAGQEPVAPEGEKPEAPSEKMLTQSEVNKLVAKEKAQAARRAEKLAAERFRAEAAERELERLRAERDPQPKAQGKPDPNDFKDWESYQDAIVDWKLEQKLQKKREEDERESKTQREQREQIERAKFVRETLFTKGQEKYPDFDEVVLGDVPFTEPMIAAASRLSVQGKAGADVLYHLGQNPEEALRISRLPDIDQVWEIQNLEAKLTAPPKPTNAPPPIVPSGTKTTVEKDPSKMTDKEFAEWRRRQIASRSS